ncbi:hypothetical protein AUK10_03765 [Candidatus Gracilibacteria bacterium CG2_30_37_12]|nr:MAG: hypothetical protein AUK10_03765 [Candidatus Gracilibacteria bacterium CG2_30_37_12]
MNYFNNIFTGCTGSGVIKSFTSSGTPVCVNKGGVWENVPLTDTTDFDVNCEYKFNMTLQNDSNYAWLNSLTAVGHPYVISSKYLGEILTTGVLYGISSNSKNTYGYRDSAGIFTATPNVTVVKIDKKCN